MQAHLGDQLVIESPATGATRRDGEIVGLHHEDGTPPYDVRWSDTGEVTLIYPGPDAHVHPLVHRPGEERPATGGPTAGEAPATGTAGTGAAAEDPGDVGRRVAAARRQQGLGLEEAARRAGMSPQYLAYLETHTSDPSPATLLRLADALGTTLAELQGGGRDRPPGRGRASRRSGLRDLDEAECRALLSTHGVGRVSLTTPQGPAVFPVNYEVFDGTIAFRTAPDAAPAAAAGHEVAFEVDHLDEAMRRGWSVLAVGRAEAVTDPEAARRLDARARTEPWAGDGARCG